jgi:hypothetical protein
VLRFLPFLIGLVLSVYAVIDCIRTDEDSVRGLPKLVWVFVILLFPFAGSIAWLLAGRPTPIHQLVLPPAPRGPDDDPDFLRRLP